MNEIPTTSYLAILALVTGGVTFLLRAFPFLAFGRSGKVPPLVEYFGRVVSPAAIAMLVIYCYCGSLSGELWAEHWFGTPEAAASVAVVALQLWKRNPLLSILTGTVLYMVLLQKIF